MRYLWVAVVILAVLLVLSVVFTPTNHGGDPSKSNQALLQAQNIAKAIRAYHYRTDGKYPDSLDQLVTRTGGIGPFLEGGEAATTDPWGKPFQFKIETDDKGNERAVVWTTNAEGKRIQWPRQ